jgi:hypothetical protein
LAGLLARLTQLEDELKTQQDALNGVKAQIAIQQTNIADAQQALTADQAKLDQAKKACEDAR